MTRPRKATVDYFPHDCEHGKTMYVLEEQFGIQGYYFWFRLLELLGATENHFIDCENPASWRFLTSKTRSTPDIAEDILSCLSDMEAIDPELWQSRIIWCQKFVDRISDAYRNRMSDIPKRPDILRKKSLSEEVSGVNLTSENRKLNKTKLKETKLNIKDLSTDQPVDRPNGLNLNQLAKLWNDKKPPELAAVNLPFTRKPKQMDKLKDCIRRNPDPVWWEKILETIHYSSFMRGKNNRGWKATFDFVVDHANEIADGKYIDNGLNQMTREEKNYVAAQQFIKDMEDFPI